MAVDKNITIRLQATDQLTPALQRAAASSASLAAMLDRTERASAGSAASMGRLGSAASGVSRGVGSASTSLSGMARSVGVLERGGARGAASLAGLSRASSGLGGNLTAGTRGLDGFGRSAERSARSSGMLVDALDAINPVTAGVGFAVAGAARSFIEFDKAMSAVAANTGAAGAELDALRQKAIELGSASQYTGAEAAQGMNELAKAGVSVDAIMSGGLKGSLDLAAAGQMQVADAAEIAASSMTMFGKSGGAVPHIADMLTTAANTAQGSVHDMGMALQQSGLVASQMGLSMEDTVGSLTTFAQAGFVGSDAGTSLKTMLQRLQSPTKGAAAELEQLGVTVYDQNGAFTGIVPIMEQFQSGLAGYSDEQKNAALNTIFGADAIRAFNAISKGGLDPLRQNIDAMGQFGTAAEQARKLTDNLAGDWERLGGAFDSVVLSSGGSVNGFLRDLVQLATAAVEVVGTIPTPVLQVATALAAVNMAGRALPDFGSTVGGWKTSWEGFTGTLARASTEVTSTSTAAQAMASTTASVSQSVVGAAQQVGVFGANSAAASRSAEQATGGFASLAGAARAATVDMTGFGAAANGTAGGVKTVAASMDVLTGSAVKTGGSVKGAANEVGNAASRLSGWSASFNGAASGFGAVAGAANKVQAPMKQASTAMTLAKTAGGSLVGFLGGPWGVAFAAAGVAVSVFAGKLAEAKQREQELAQVSQTVASAVAYSGGQFDLAAQQAYLHSTATQQVGEELEKLGYSSKTVALALTSEGSARQMVTSQIDAQIRALMAEDAANQVVTDSGIAVTGANQARINQLSELRTAMQGSIDAAQQGIAAGQSQTEQTEALTAANQNAATSFTSLSGAAGGADAEIKLSASAAESAAEKFDAFRDAITKVGNAMLGQRDAARGFQAAIDEAAEAVAQNGRNLDITSEKGRANQAALDGIANAGLRAASQQWQLTGSLEQTARAMEQTRTEFISAATAMGMPRSEAVALADQMGLTSQSAVELARQMGQIPADTNIDFSSTGTEKLITDTRTITEQTAHVPGLVTVNAVMNGAAGVMGELAGVQREAVAADQVDPTVNTTSTGAAETRRQLADVASSALGVPAAVRMLVSQTGAQGAQSMIDRAAQAGREYDALHPNANVSQTGAQASGAQIQGASSKAREYDAINANANVSVSGVSGAISQINSLIARARDWAGRTFTAWFRSGTVNADGNYFPSVQAFANGSERHVAQIARAGAWRLWAEPETDGEAYIPLAESKRARSSMILHEVARRFGYDLVKQARGGLMEFANGGTTLPNVDVVPSFQNAKFGQAKIPVTAVITGVQIKTGVKAPFLYTAGGTWDRGRILADVNTQAINERYQELHVTAKELADAAKALADARKNATQTGTATLNVASGADKGTMTGALAKAPTAIRRLITEIAGKYGISPNLVAAVIQQESGFKTTARSRAGAQGLMQLMPGTAKSLGVKNAYDARQNIEGGVKYLAQLFDQFNGNLSKVLAAYNAGPGNVLKYKGIPPFKETQNYVQKILADPGLTAGVSPSSGSAAGNATAVGKAAGNAIVATNKKTVAAMKAQVKAKATPDDARAAALANAIAFEGKGRYVWGGAHSATAYKDVKNALTADCSGFVGTIVGNALGRNVTSTAARMLSGNKQLGWVKIDPNLAAKTAGAILGDKGHVVLSLGDGRVAEHYSKGKPVRIRKIAKRDMQMAAWNVGFGDINKAGKITPGQASMVPGAPDLPSATDMLEYTQALDTYNKMLAASKVPAYRQLAQATQGSTTYSRQFLDNISRIAKRGFPEVAARILAMGEADGAAAAASFATAPDAALRQQRANYKANADQVTRQKELERSLSSYAGPPAWQTANNEAKYGNGVSKRFLDDVDKIAGMGYLDLAFRLLDMGETDGGDIARQAAAMKPGVNLRALSKNLATDPTATQRLQAQVTARATLANMGHATREANKTSEAFLANIRKIRDRGYGDFALSLMEQGEAAAGPLAAEAAKASDASLRAITAANSKRDSIEAQAERLLADMRGVGRILNVTVGLATGQTPGVAWTAPRGVDARPAYAATQYRAPAPTAPVQAQAVPVVQIGTMTTVDPNAAAKAINTKFQDALAVAGIGR